MLLLFVALVAVTLAFALPSVAQEEYTEAAPEEYTEAAPEEYTEAAPEETQVPAEAGCDWYYGYSLRRSGSWEYWCWDPYRGWWYAESEDGKSKMMFLTA